MKKLQKISEAFYKEMKYIKDNEIDLKVAEKHFEETIVEENWRKVLKSVPEDCINRLKSTKQEFQMKIEAAPFKIKKEDCDAQLSAFNTCTTLEAFLVFFTEFQMKILCLIYSQKCPSEFWKVNKECSNIKIWINRCGKSVHFLAEFAPK